MTPEDRDDLHHESVTLAYEWMKLSGLLDQMSNEAADELADQIATHVDREIETRVDERFTQIESVKLKVDNGDD